MEEEEGEGGLKGMKKVGGRGLSIWHQRVKEGLGKVKKEQK